MTPAEIGLIFVTAMWLVALMEQWRLRQDLRRTDSHLLAVENTTATAQATARRAEQDAATALSKIEMITRDPHPDIDVPVVDGAALMGWQRNLTDIPDGDDTPTDTIHRKDTTND